MRNKIDSFLHNAVDNAIIEYKRVVDNVANSRRYIGPFAHYESSEEIMEFFSRLSLGILFELNENADEHITFFNQELVRCTNPSVSNYWGKIDKPCQRTVELPSLAMVLFFKRVLTWDTYTNREQEYISDYLLQVNCGNIQRTNWLFFRIIVNEITNVLIGKRDITALQEAYEGIDELYLGDGWYVDGKDGNRVDFYNAFAFHYYGLLLSLIVDNKYTDEYKKRAELFGHQFIYLFSTNGSVVPYGRSLTYRMAICAFWSACVATGVYPFSLEVIKGLIVRHFDWWNKQSILDSQGLLTVGYSYPNLIVSEFYNAYGSPYWAMKFFAFMLVNSDSDFWSCKCGVLPELENRFYSEVVSMAFCRDADGHSCLFPNRNVKGMFIDNYKAKYMKIAYSNLFGFSVKRSDRLFAGGAYDSELSVSVDGQFFTRGRLTDTCYRDGFLISRWCPIRDVVVTSYVFPGIPWHVRIHIIETTVQVQAVDAGFAVCSDGIDEMHTRSSVELSNIEVTSCVVSLINGAKMCVERCCNTNVLSPRTVIPCATYDLPIGTGIIADGFYGGKRTDIKNENVPKFYLYANKFTIMIDDIKQTTFLHNWSNVL